MLNLIQKYLNSGYIDLISVILVIIWQIFHNMGF